MVRPQWLLLIAFALVLFLATGRAQSQPPPAEQYPRMVPPTPPPSVSYKQIEQISKERAKNTVAAIKIGFVVVCLVIGVLGAMLKRSSKEPR